MSHEISIAIETSCRKGGLAIARGDELLYSVSFDASARHTTQLISRMSEMLSSAGLAPDSLEHVYVSVGPGSFTGLRIGITVARTMAQLLPKLKCVAVPADQACAQNASGLDWTHLGVVLAAKGESAYTAVFDRRGSQMVLAKQPKIVRFDDFLARAPKPILLLGEGVAYFEVDAPGVSVADGELWLPTAKGVWSVGRAMADEGQFTEYHKLLPNYGRKPEAVRLWDQRVNG